MFSYFVKYLSTIYIVIAEFGVWRGIYILTTFFQVKGRFKRHHKVKRRSNSGSDLESAQETKKSKVDESPASRGGMFNYVFNHACHSK